MKVRAQLFSRLKEIAGEPAIDVEVHENASAGELFASLVGKYPALRSFENSVLFGIGVEFVGKEHKLRDGDVVAIMPPVQGG